MASLLGGTMISLQNELGPMQGRRVDSTASTARLVFEITVLLLEGDGRYDNRNSAGCVAKFNARLDL